MVVGIVWIVCRNFLFVIILYFCIMLCLFDCTTCCNHNQVSDMYCLFNTFQNWDLLSSSENSFHLKQTFTVYISQVSIFQILDKTTYNTHEGVVGIHLPYVTQITWGEGMRYWIVLQTCSSNGTAWGAPTTKSIATTVPRNAGVRSPPQCM
jgi:hypothetical protein